MSMLPCALRVGGRVLLSPEGEVSPVFAVHTWCTGILAQPRALQVPAWGALS